MKNLKLTLGLLVITTAFTACTDEKKEQAEKDVAMYTKYVDSVSSLEMEQASLEWDAIQNNYDTYKMNAENSLNGVSENENLQESINTTTVKYEDYKVRIVTEKEKMNMQNPKTAMRRTLLGVDYDGSNDMSFTWVNKDNIADVYGTFVATVDKNKDAYSREDWDEIKLIYEALDTRKNTVENEGLSGEDNRRIAGLKIKFAPMYTLNRMGAKSEENAEAKK
jgi:hypothetical protein